MSGLEKRKKIARSDSPNLGSAFVPEALQWVFFWSDLISVFYFKTQTLPRLIHACASLCSLVLVCCEEDQERIQRVIVDWKTAFICDF